MAYLKKRRQHICLFLNVYISTGFDLGKSDTFQRLSGWFFFLSLKKIFFFIETPYSSCGRLYIYMNHET